MTTLPDPPVPSPGRPGRKLGPVVHGVGSTHRAWLMPVREKYLVSGLTLNELSIRVSLAKSKISELLRGTGLYPRWEIVLSLATELDLPQWPLLRLWQQAALDAHKTREWIERSGGKPFLTASGPPLEHQAFQELVEDDYRLYAQAFLDDHQRDTAVSDTFDILWLSWNDALASYDTRHYAWQVLRACVMSRTLHLDGRPELAHAAFDTVALYDLTDEADRISQIEESLNLFKAISRLPDHQLDVVVLSHLYAMDAERVSNLLGVSLATVRSEERYAVQHLDSVICPPT
ncbi:sigma-70 family RNA polymerase sigma factor [Streptomyces sp. NPDC002455]